MIFLQFILAGVAVLAVAAGVYRAILPVRAPDFLQKPVLDRETLLSAVAELAAACRQAKPRGAGLSTRLLQRKLKAAYITLAQKFDAGEDELYGFERWIYDNYYKCNERLTALKRQAYRFAFLPHCEELPRVYLLAEFLIKSAGGYLTDELLLEAVRRYCGEAPLSYPEVSAMGAAVEYALLEYIVIFASKAVKIAELTQKAKNDARKGKADITQFRYHSYVDTLYRYSSDSVRGNIAKLCENNGLSVFSRIERMRENIVRYGARVENAVGSLFRLPEILSEKNRLLLSPVHHVLCETGGVLYAGLTDDSKRYYLSRIHERAKRKKIADTAFAKKIAAAAAEKNTDISAEILPKEKGKAVAALYIILCCAATGLSSAAVAFFAPVFSVAAGLISIPVSFLIAGTLIAAIHKNAFKRAYLPAVAFSESDANNHPCAIVVPRLVADSGEIADAFAHIETIIAANPEPVFSYCLLLDYPSNKQEVPQTDREMNEACEKFYRECGQKNRLSVLVRKRKKDRNGEKFQGWEKKRGAILDFNALILGRGTKEFSKILGDIPAAEFAITLDCDTLINSCIRLYEIMLHPFNAKKNIVSVRMNSAAASKNERTAFSRMFAGAEGTSHYTMYDASVENDLFGQGNYTGKGIYRIREFQAAVGEAFLDNRLLCHDFIEGAYAGCAVSAETGLDAFPRSYGKFFTRHLRWLKGDWQLLPFLFRKVRGRDGKKYKNPISAVAKWHILSSMIHSLVPAASLSLLILALFSPSAVVFFSVAFAPYAVHLIIAARSSVLHRDTAFFSELIRQLFLLSVLPVAAVYTLAAVFITLIRLLTKRKLLEWKTFSHASGKISFIPNAVVSIALAVSAVFLYPSPVFFALSFLFAVGILLNYLFAKTLRDKPAFPHSFDERLLEMFRSGYRFFTEGHLEKNHFLPCDNIQFEVSGKPARRAALRTSPTNIGFALIAHISAFAVGITDRNTMLSYCSDIIGTVEKMEKWNGNLYNWTDIQNLKSLSGYVSCVDSGNFLISLLLLSVFADGSLKKRTDKLIKNTQIERFLDPERKLFAIGYDENTGGFDSGRYDLLASEAVISYMAAIAANKIGKDSIGALSRFAFKTGVFSSAFASWTGGAFEYLMAALFFEFSPHSAVYRSMRASVRSQIRYAKRKKLSAWGISESQYAAEDEAGNYQYKAFGIGEVSLCNAKDTSVVAPYASFLSLPLAPKEALQNLEALKKIGLCGEYGFYESHDFADRKTMKTVMSHHLGMSLAAIANAVTDNGIAKALETHPGVRAAKLTMTETAKVPALRKTGVYSRPLPAERLPPARVYRDRLRVPRVNLLSVGQYAAVLNQDGGGYCVFGGKSVTRPDTTELSAESDGVHFNLLGGDFTAAFDSSFYEKEFERLSSGVRVTLLPDGNGELRFVKLFNKTNRPLVLSLSAKIEPVLTAAAADIAHRAFSDLFIQTEFDRETDTVCATRNNTPAPLHVIYGVIGADAVAYNTDRRAYYGRTGADFAVRNHPIEPVLSAHLGLTLPPKKAAEIVVYTLCGTDKRELLREAKALRTAGYIESRRAEHFAIAKKNRVPQLICSLAANLLHNAQGYGRTDSLARFFSVSRPLICYKARDKAALPRLRAELSELKVLYRFGISFDLYILYQEPRGYFMEMNEALHAALDETSIRSVLPEGCALYVLNEAEEPEKAKAVLQACITPAPFDTEAITRRERQKVKRYPSVPINVPDIVLPCGIGGMTETGAFFADLSKTQTPRPYSNILCNGQIGTMVTESGGGYSWFGNARQQKISHWSNDSVLDSPGEFALLSEGGLAWSVTQNPARYAGGGGYGAEHGLGYSEWQCGANGIKASQTVFLHPEKPLKFILLQLENHSGIKRKIGISYALNPVLGDFKQYTRTSLFAAAENGRVKIGNRQTGIFAYIHCSGPIISFTRTREAFTDRDGRTVPPETDSEGSEFFPCIMTETTLTANGNARIIFSVGAEETVDFSESDALLETAKRKASSLAAVRIHGDSPWACLSRWLPVQTLNCRFLARAGFYQAGGAIGFRDQLQDCLSLLYIEPSLVRRHILVAAARQFSAGDVLHWWHPPFRGVRTRISDDRLFLPFVTAEYVLFTGDTEILGERIPYLAEKSIPPMTKDLYADFEPSHQTATLLEHCVKAVEVSCDFGKNGLCRMGTGDWNDGMDGVGAEGIGTSVFTSQLLVTAIRKLVPFIPEVKRRAKFLDIADKLQKALKNAFEGDRFLRAFTDGGKKIGSQNAAECKIDLLTQAWAVLSETGTAEQRKAALGTAEKFLCQNGILRLLNPPFVYEKETGYIANYPPGVRENGGQYSHAAVWFVMALVQSGQTEKAWKYFEQLSPFTHTATYEKALRYGNEPFVLSADVYAGEHEGRGGWSWYTGAASWYYKCLVECFLGVKVRGRKVSFSPRLPESVPQLSFTLRMDGHELDIKIDNSPKKGNWKIKIDNLVYTAPDIELSESLKGRRITVLKIQ